MNIALVAHDKKKDNIVKFSVKYKSILKNHNLFATGTTGTRIHDVTGLEITRYLSGPLGGDQQIGSLIAYEKLDLVIFLRDPLTSQPHEPDVQALLRLCDVHKLPVATNITTAEILLLSMNKNPDWKAIKAEY
ncbi:methylglyoxal synthase [Helicovermis profundi]|uniref:Methylglyoxal synthase n=1 Tax=Helicovermis profundi TaxID=3065157 RepID=A0AAU9E7N4_9FIRM|nr:methylglyoxal synthase [Clostridia bacterium S502]